MRLFHFPIEDFQSRDIQTYDIQEKGFVLKKDIRDKLAIRISRLLEKAPARAFANMDIEKGSKEFSAQLTIESIPRTFTAQAKGPSPMAVFNKLEGVVEKQLDQWRKTRFMDIALIQEETKWNPSKAF